MSEKHSSKGCHLTILERIFIEDSLTQNMSLLEVARRLSKDPTTISKEVKRNRSIRGSRNANVTCHFRSGCRKRGLCKENCTMTCYKCRYVNCYRVCPDYTPKICPRLKRYPYVCNGCMKSNGCMLVKYDYSARTADARYLDTLSKARQGADITKKELEHLDKLITPLVTKGQSIAHIHENHRDEIGCCQRTLYNYFERNMFTARNIDLPRKVKYKKRKTKQEVANTGQKYRKGRTYADFLAYIEEYPDTPVVEMDTVHGSRGGKTLLTLFFRNCSLMLAFLMESCTQDCVHEVIEWLYDTLGADAFCELFPVILTDNGSEFKAPSEIECDADGVIRTKVFYCDPYASYQKARLEKNHEYIRYILPKGKTFKNLTQDAVTLMMNHINSTARASRNGCNPYQLAQMHLNNALLDKLSLEPIPADEVLLKPALLKK